MARLLAIGECMVELGDAGSGLLRKGFAGDTLNAAYYARTYLPAAFDVAYLSAVGTDLLSAEMLAFIGDKGILTEDVLEIEGAAPGLYMIHLKEGERSFSYWRSASAARRLAEDPAHLRRAIEKADTIVFSGITLAILSPEARETLILELRRAKAAGRRVVFDPNIRPRLWEDAATLRAVVEAGARASTILVPSFDDEQAHFADADPEATIARYRQWGADTVLVKNGSGAACLSNGTDAIVRITPPRVQTVVDTTSAGDSFNGAFLARLLTGVAPAEAAAFAARVAAAVIAHHGALVPPEHLPQALDLA
ncbi:sugar kinase [Rhizobium sp. Leaf341]|uniref:sugar kinase n=1 Tax=Rhizobium sp. Leaf341 TaxID=1736344 RepID=UPI0007123DF9|nr:sugar kinase [Rhizobium sp. Leaf341]KQR69153.1 2-dehydro-3-deoxygluconokinase [Rhizobium sp. Leaf341]